MGKHSITLYDLNSSDDSTAWEYREIRSHRAARQSHPVRRRVVLLLAAVVAAGGLIPLSDGASTPAASAEAHVAAEPVARAVAPVVERRQIASRSMRVMSARQQKIEKTISFAMAQRGDRYRWGATGPNSWDCSGLVMKSFKKAGKNLPHYTGGIQRKGKKVSRKNMRRGDIVFPQHGHVGIYLGGGKMIHASSGKHKVVVAKVYGFYTARRVL